MSWPTVALGEIFEIARGGSPRPIDDYITDDPEGVNWISIKDASNSSKYIDATAKKILRSGVSRSREVKPGDFLLTNSMSFGRPYILRTSGCIHDGWLVLSGDDSQVDKNYFYHLLGSDFIYRKFQSLAAGAVVKNLNIELVKTVKVPFPPLTEQRRIAAMLDTIDALRTNRREAIAKLDRLLKSVYFDMFGDPSNSSRWDQVKLHALAKIASGGTPDRSISEYYGGNIPWVKSGELAVDEVLSTEETLTDGGLESSSAKIMPVGTVLLAMYGATAGAVSVLGVEAATNQAICCISPGDRLNKIFLVEFLRGIAATLLAKRVGGAQPNLNQGLIREIEIPLPTMDMQLEFEKRSLAIRAQKKLLERAASLNDKLFVSTLRTVFSEATEK